MFPSYHAFAQSPAEDAGFVISQFATGFDEPIAMEFAPDGRLFVAERGGTIRFARDGAAVSPAFATIEVYSENENGLLGLALDSQFSENGYVYVFATVSRNEQRILRFTELDGIGTEMTVIRPNLPTRGEFHSGGGLKFGPDGKLYFSIGDNLIAENAQDITTLAGKISRINRDGSTPADNPFLTPTGQPRAIYALGFRNPFRFCFAPDGRLFALDVGSDGDGRREEINLVRAGGNHGWPWVEGTQQGAANPLFVDPLYDYHDGGAAPVGAVYYTGEAFPPEYRGNLFHLEYVLNRVYRVVLDGDRVVSHELFHEGESGPVDMIQGPDGALYFCELHSGVIRRVQHSSYQPPASETPVEAEVIAGETTTDPDERPPGMCGNGVLLIAPIVLGSLVWRSRARNRG